jgi:hypothetical protein
MEGKPRRQTEISPVDMKRYFRNGLCPEYCLCLDYAAKKRLELDCSQCERRNEKFTTPADEQGCRALLQVIFHPDFFSNIGNSFKRVRIALNTVHDLEKNRIVSTRKNFND